MGCRDGGVDVLFHPARMHANARMFCFWLCYACKFIFCLHANSCSRFAALWNSSAEEELDRIRDVVERYPYIALVSFREFRV